MDEPVLKMIRCSGDTRIRLARNSDVKASDSPVIVVSASMKSDAPAPSAAVVAFVTKRLVVTLPAWPNNFDRDRRNMLIGDFAAFVASVERFPCN